MSLLDQFFVYHPEPWQDRDWARLTGLPLEEVWFQAADGRGCSVGTLRRRRIGLSVFIFNCHGYGRSQGRPSEEGFDRGCVQ